MTKLRAAEAHTARRLGEPYGPLRSLSIKLQAIGHYLEDRTPITFAALLAMALGGFVLPPGYDA